MRQPALLLLVFVPLSVSILVTACGDDDDDDDDDVVMYDADPGAPDAPDNTPDAAPPDAPGPEFCTPQSGTNLQLVEVASGLERPVFVTAPSGDPRLFIVEQPGVISVLKNGNLLPTPFLDIEDSLVFNGGNEQGLLGLAFHPDYATNGKFYVNYTAVSGGGAVEDDTVVAEYTVSSGEPDVADTAERRLMIISQPFSNHNGGWIGFGPDGYLYIAVGDGGSGGDPGNRGQDVDELLGKMLRIDVDTGDPYGIPADNPFVGGAGLDEIWAYGLRNPWRNSFDRETGDLWMGDVGQNAVEEIDFQDSASAGGHNYGWRILEGNSCYNPSVGCVEPTGYVPPITDYPQTGGRCSVTGGYVYRGECLTDYKGLYFYGDYCSGDVYTLVQSGGVVTTGPDNITTDLDPGGLLEFNLSSFGEDAFGELYITSLFGGRVYRIAIE